MIILKLEELSCILVHVDIEHHTLLGDIENIKHFILFIDSNWN